MAVRVNQSQIVGEAAAPGVARQRLMTTESNATASVLLDRLAFAAGACHRLEVAASHLAWFIVLDGELRLEAGGRGDDINGANVCFVPPGFSGELRARTAASVLFAEVPDAARFDPGLTAGNLGVRIVDWTREPVLSSAHDARKRIYLVTPKLFGTRAIKGEMIIYPPGTEAANHHHEGAEHFMYVLAGGGTAWADEEPFAVREGDLIWYSDRERHYLRSATDGEMRFVEFFVPGTYKTTWALGAKVCTWSPTGRNIRGGPPSRDIAHHRSDAGMPADV